MSPEQKVKKWLTDKTDIYSLSIIMYEVVSEFWDTESERIRNILSFKKNDYFLPDNIQIY